MGTKGRAPVSSPVNAADRENVQTKEQTLTLHIRTAFYALTWNQPAQQRQKLRQHSRHLLEQQIPTEQRDINGVHSAVCDLHGRLSQLRHTLHLTLNPETGTARGGGVWKLEVQQKPSTPGIPADSPGRGLCPVSGSRLDPRAGSDLS